MKPLKASNVSTQCPIIFGLSLGLKEMIHIPLFFKIVVLVLFDSNDNFRFKSTSNDTLCY